MCNNKINKICFYYVHPQVVSGGLYYFYRLAEHCSLNSDYKIYIMNHKNHPYTDFYRKSHDCSKMIFINYEDDCNELMKNTLFFLYLNQLPIFLEKFKKAAKTCRIFLIDFHFMSFNFLCSNIQCTNNKDIVNLADLFNKTASITFMDKPCREGVIRKTGINFSKNYIPAFLDKKNIKPQYARVISKNEINLGCICRLDVDKIQLVINLLNCLYNLSENKKINVHLIGNGSHKHLIDVSHYQQKFNLIMLDYMQGDELNSYIYDHIDAMFNVGIAALEAAALKIPVIVIPYSMKPFDLDKYIFLFDTKDYCLGYEACNILDQGLKTHSLENIIKLLYIKGNKQKLGEKCYKHFIKKHTVDIAYHYFMKYGLQSTLTIQKCFENSFIKKTVFDFSEYRKKGKDWNYYTKNRNKKNLSLKNKLYYKIWKHLDKKVSKKGLLYEKPQNFYDKIQYKLWKKLNKRLIKKGIIKAKNLWLQIENEKKFLLHKLAIKYKKNKIIKVAFLHQYATGTQAYPVFDKMLENKTFDPYWIVNPDISRSKDNFDYQYKRTKEILINKYGKDRVLDGFDYKNEEFIDYSDKFDLATTTNPYERMAHKLFQILYWTKKVPMFYISYFYMGRCFVSVNNLKNPQFNYFWKVFAENEYVKELAKKYQVIKGQNIDVVGYAKMDALPSVNKIKMKRKKIILAPHHSIDENELSCGAFLYFHDIILELPNKYPNIDFVYRPHPLLKERLQSVWGKEKTDNWLNKMQLYPNVYFSEEGEYFDLFVNSSALIHDCGSFMAEYLFVDHPCAYLIKPTANYNKMYTKFGHECLEAHALISNQEELYKFIDEAVINENDEKKTYRNKFVEKSLMINYPNATNKIIEIIEKEIKEK